MKKTNKLFYILPICLLVEFVTSCNNEEIHNQTSTNESGISNFTRQDTSFPPFPIVGAECYENIPYGEHQRNVFDIFIPTTSTSPKELVIFVHGGGFTGGDKSSGYRQEDITYYLNHNIAYATVNYRLEANLTNDGIVDEEDVINSMNDVKRCVQYIKSVATQYNINKNKIGICGSSAGGGCSLWVGLKDDMKDLTSSDPVLHESTRVQAIGHLHSQASYNPKTIGKIFKNYNCTNLPDPNLDTPSVDLISFMSTDDPEIYIYNINTPLDSEVCYKYLHSPHQARALYLKANQIGLANQCFIPYYTANQIPRTTETLTEFMKRKLQDE